MPLRYYTGEVVTKGDRVLLSKEVGVIDFIADPLFKDLNTLWFVEKYGGGVMVTQLKHLGSVFTNPEEDADLEFVSREPNP